MESAGTWGAAGEPAGVPEAQGRLGKGRGQVISPAGHQAEFLQREKENGGEAGNGGKTLDTTADGVDVPRMLSMGPGKFRKAERNPESKATPTPFSVQTRKGTPSSRSHPPWQKPVLRNKPTASVM